MDVIETILMLVLSIGMRGKAHSWLEDPDDVRASSFFYSLIRMTPLICRVTKLLRVQCVCNILVIYCRQRTNRLKSCNFVVIFYFFLSLSSDLPSVWLVFCKRSNRRRHSRLIRQQSLALGYVENSIFVSLPSLNPQCLNVLALPPL